MRTAPSQGECGSRRRRTGFFVSDLGFVSDFVIRIPDFRQEVLVRRWLFLILLACGSTLRADTFSVPATVEAFEQTDLYPRVGGYVTAVNVDLGDAVKAGEALAVIDAPELVKELDEAKATLIAKTRGAEAAAAAVRQAKAALDVSRRQVERFKADAEYQRITLKRQQELFGGKAITDQQIDEAKNKAAIAEADLGVAQSKAAGAEADLLGAQAGEAVAGAQV